MYKIKSEKSTFFVHVSISKIFTADMRWKSWLRCLAIATLAESINYRYVSAGTAGGSGAQAPAPVVHASNSGYPDEKEEPAQPAGYDAAPTGAPVAPNPIPAPPSDGYGSAPAPPLAPPASPAGGYDKYFFDYLKTSASFAKTTYLELKFMHYNL